MLLPSACHSLPYLTKIKAYGKSPYAMKGKSTADQLAKGLLFTILNRYYQDIRNTVLLLCKYTRCWSQASLLKKAKNFQYTVIAKWKADIREGWQLVSSNARSPKHVSLCHKTSHISHNRLLSSFHKSNNSYLIHFSGFVFNE